MNTANKITMLRIILVPIFMVFMMIDSFTMHMIGLAVFIIASITDCIDGQIARKYNQITTFGKFVDPLADKILTTAAFLALMSYGKVSAWAVMLIMTREFVVAGVRQVAVAEGKVIAASFWGKLKTVAQMVAIIASILLMSTPTFIGVSSDLWINILVWISVGFTVISGADYLVKNWSMMELK